MEAAATAETVGKETETLMMSKSLAAAVVAATAATAEMVGIKTVAAAAATAASAATAAMVPLRLNLLVEEAAAVSSPTEEAEEL